MVIIILQMKLLCLIKLVEFDIMLSAMLHQRHLINIEYNDLLALNFTIFLPNQNLLSSKNKIKMQILIQIIEL